MVAVGDFGCGERERMVELATAHGWVQKNAAWAAKRGHAQAVVLLATDDAWCPGALGDIVKNAVAKLGHLKQIRRKQAAAGLRPFVVFSLPLNWVQQLVDPGTACELQAAAGGNEYAVLCMNGDRLALVAGVTRDTEAAT